MSAVLQRPSDWSDSAIWEPSVQESVSLQFQIWWQEREDKHRINGLLRRSFPGPRFDPTDLGDPAANEPAQQVGSNSNISSSSSSRSRNEVPQHLRAPLLTALNPTPEMWQQVVVVDPLELPPTEPEPLYDLALMLE
jgi:hypothetical protein